MSDWVVENLQTGETAIVAAIDGISAMDAYVRENFTSDVVDWMQRNDYVGLEATEAGVCPTQRSR